MPYFQVRHTLAYSSGLPTDVVVNTWTVFDDGTGDVNAAGAAFTDFYTATATGATNPLGEYIAPIVSRVTNAHTVTFAELNVVTGELQPPAGAFTFTMPAPIEDTSLPLETALCTTFVATGTGAIARRRGRVYLGPWIAGANGGGGGNPPQPTGQVVVDVAAATEQLYVDLVAADVPLAVWSRMDQVARLVERGWVDDEWDTMRSRQIKARERIIWPTP